MPNYRLVAPVIRWNTNLGNAVYFPFPLDNVFSGSEPRAGSEFTQGPSGIEAAWRVGTDYVLTGANRWLAQSDTLFYPRCTGWDSTLGILAALEWLQNRNTFSWHPDGRNLLRLPLLNSAGAATLGGVGGWATAQNGTPSGVTNAFSGGETAWQLTGTGVGAGCAVYLKQDFPSMPGEIVTLSADYKAVGLTNGATGVLQINALDSSRAFISTVLTVSGLTATSYTRASGTSSAAPAGTAYLQPAVIINLPNTGAGTVYFKNVLARRDSTDTTFVDNPSVDGCYWVEPTQFSPANEQDGSRRMMMRIRHPSTPFVGY